MEANVKTALDALRAAFVALEATLDAPAVVVAPVKGKTIDWDATKAATEAHFNATGKWVSMEVYTDGTQVGPKAPVAPAPPPPPPVVVPVPPPAPAGAAVWAGVDKLSHRYGHTWEREGIITVSSWAGDGFKPSGAMQPPRQGGNGYGVYTVDCDGSKTNGPGKFLCIWPEPDKWFWEIDIAENDFNGDAYATIHWGAVKPDGTDGKDESRGYPIPGVRLDERHVWECTWARDLIVIKVDGVEKVRITENVPRDASDGGHNGLLGVGMQPEWAAHAQNGDNTITAYACSYRKLA